MCLSQRGKSCVDPSWDRIKAAKRLCPQHQTQRWRAEVCKNDRGHGKWKLIKMGFSLAIYVTTKHEENLTCASMPCKTPYSIPLLDDFPLHNGNCLSFCPRNAEARDILPKIEDLFSKEWSNVVQLMKSDWLLGLPFGSFNLMLKAFGSARKDLFQTLDLHDAIPKSQQYQSISISTSISIFISWIYV